MKTYKKRLWQAFAIVAAVFLIAVLIVNVFDLAECYRLERELADAEAIGLEDAVPYLAAKVSECQN